MMEQLNPQSRRDAFGSKINRDHSVVLAYGIPWLSILLGSLTPMLPVIAAAPILPPMGFIMMLSWRLYRPGLLPMWAGFPLGLFDDLLSGQPLGCGILLFSLSLIAMDLLEINFPWRGFFQNWLICGVFVAVYLVFAALFSGASIGIEHLILLVPQLVFGLAIFPPAVALVGALDWLRLLRVIRMS